MIWTWPGSVVTRVIDGDSLTARMTKVSDIGFHGKTSTTFEQKLRLERINTPKISSAKGKAAAQRVGELVAMKEVLIETTGPYKYGDEWMAEVTLPDGRNLSDLLVSEGFAVYWDGTGPRPNDA